jgi:serine/threonine-protein kinase
MAPATPLQTLGKYHLIAELGHGGMADVYLAVAQGPAGFSKLQVIKQLRPALAENPEIVSMFLDEARLAARLNHPNVVQTYEVEQDGELCFIAMEYLDGQPLDRILRRARKQGALPLPLHLRILSDALMGLHHAHELCDFDGTPLRVVHRDVSPHNIFVTYDGQVKVVDFGIAKAANGSAETRTGVLKGKIAYMSPEQALGETLDRRSDLFAVGILLHEALSGDRFWKTTTEVQILHKLSNGLIPSVDELPQAPPALRRICARALARKLSDRYATAADFHEDLEAFLREIGSPPEREVGAYVASLFQDRRQQARAVVEEQLRALREQGAPPSVRPNLHSLQQTLSVNATTNDGTSLSPATVEPPRVRTPWWVVAAVGGAAALGALGLHALTSSPAPSAPAVAPSAVLPALAELRLRAIPASARFFLDDTPLPGNPFAGKFPRDGASHRLRIEAPGFATTHQLVLLDGDRDLAIDLVPEVTPSSAADERKDDRKDARTVARAGTRQVAPSAPSASAAALPEPPPDELPAPGVKKKPAREIDKDDPWQ